MCVRVCVYTRARGAQMYIPVHVLPLLLFRLAQLRRHPRATLASLGAGIARSCLFMAVYTSVLRAGVCTLRHARGRDEWWHAVACGLGTAAAARLESPKRTHELMLYCAMHAVDVLHGLAKQAAGVRPVPGGDVLLFAASLSALLCVDRSSLGGGVRSVLEFLFGPPAAASACNGDGDGSSSSIPPSARGGARCSEPSGGTRVLHSEM
jgi:hypothetical protein